MLGKINRTLAFLLIATSFLFFFACYEEADTDSVSVGIEANKYSLYADEQLPLTAQVEWLKQNHDGWSLGYEWSVDNTELATIDDADKQTAYLSAKFYGKTQVSVKVTVFDENARKIGSVVTDKSFMILSRIKPSNKGYEAVLLIPESSRGMIDENTIWNSSDNSIATIDSNGVITTHSQGSTEISASRDNTTFASFMLDVAIPVESIRLEPATASIQAGEQIKLKAFIEPENATDKQIYWGTPQSGFARVTLAGEEVEIVGVKPGQGAISVMTHDGAKTASASLEVVDTIRVKQVTLNQTSLSMRYGNEATLEATISPENALAKTVQWQSSDPSVVSILANGNTCDVKIISLPDTDQAFTITARSSDGPEAVCQVNIVKKAVESIQILSNKSFEMQNGADKKLNASVYPQDADDTSVVWSSSNPDVISVDADGNVSVKRLPSSDEQNPIVITATASSGVKDSVNITVEVPITAIQASIQDNKNILGLAKSAMANVSFIPSNTTQDRTIIWSSDDLSVAAVDQDGVISAKGAGQTRIVATNPGTGYTSAVDFTVVKTDSISLSAQDMTMLWDGQSDVQAQILTTPDQERFKTLVWSSSDESIATVDNAGHISAHSPGEATISVKNLYDDSTVSSVSLSVIKIKSVSLSKSSASLKGDTPFTLTANVDVEPNREIYKKVKWVCDNPNLVELVAIEGDENSINLVAKGITEQGPVTVKAISLEDSRVVDVCRVTTGVSIKAVEIVSDSTTLKSTQTLNLSANVSTVPEVSGFDAVEWVVSSQDAGVESASITQDGVLSAIGKGNVVVSAISKVDSSRFATKSIYVVPNVSNIALDSSVYTLHYGESITLQPTVDVVPSNYNAVTYTFDPTFLSVNDDGVLRAKKVTCIEVNGIVSAPPTGLLLKSVEDEEASFSASVYILPDVTITDQQNTLSLAYSDSLQLSPAISSYPEGYESVEWRSSDSDVVSVTPEGLIKAEEIGFVSSEPVVITATSRFDNQRSISYTVNVVPKFIASEFVINPASLSMAAEENLQLSLGNFVLPNRAPYNEVMWSSSDTSIATVDQTGLVTSIADGNSTISVSSLYQGANLGTSSELKVESGVRYVKMESGLPWSIYAGKKCEWDGTAYISTDGENWSEWSLSDAKSNGFQAGLNEQTGHYEIYLRGKGNTYFREGLNYNGPTNVSCPLYSYNVYPTLEAGGILLSGNIMSLLDYENLSDEIPTERCFANLFSRFGKAYTTNREIKGRPEGWTAEYTLVCNNYNLPIVEVAEGFLPATKLKEQCYVGMFYYLTSLRRVPANLLPALEVPTGAYAEMFASCMNLEELPALPATTVSGSGYERMFEFNFSAVKIPYISLKQALSAELTDGTVKDFSMRSFFDQKGSVSLHETYDLHFYIGPEPLGSCVNACSDVWQGDVINLGDKAFSSEEAEDVYFTELHPGDRIWTNAEVVTWPE